jgi:aquaporin Z
MPAPAPSLTVKALIEFIGTFFLVGVVGLAIGQITPGGGELDAFAIAGALAALIYMGGPISGAHYNPAVTIAFAVSRRMPSCEVLPYILAQVAGGFAAAGLVSFTLPESAFVATTEVASCDANLKLAVLEFFFTFFLIFTIMNVAARKSAAGNSYFGLAIGLVVLCGALTVGPISGAVFNPAVALGLSAMEVTPWSMVLWYFGAQFAAAFVAAGVFEVTSPDS